jgi:hypothetical protein
VDERDVGLSEEARRDRQLAEREIAEREQRGEPHHDLANPVGEPDPTETEDPYEQSDEEPRDPPPPRNIDRLRAGEGEG